VHGEDLMQTLGNRPPISQSRRSMRWWVDSMSRSCRPTPVPAPGGQACRNLCPSRWCIE